MLLGIWAHDRLVPDRRQSAVVTDLILALFLLLVLTNISSPAQYAAVTLKGPLIDGWLAASDSGTRDSHA